METTRLIHLAIHSCK